jgi:RHS repeat-associated protein
MGFFATAAYAQPRVASETVRPERQVQVPGSRSYSPGQGRWVSRDPAGERGGANLTAFVLNNPVRRIDRLGLISCGSCNFLLRKLLAEKEVNEIVSGLLLREREGKACLEGPPSCECHADRRIWGTFEPDTRLVKINCKDSPDDPAGPDHTQIKYTLIHELQHASEHCNRTKDTDCRERVEGELRANICARECDPWVDYEHCTKRALESIALGRQCPGASEEVLRRYAREYRNKFSLSQCLVPDPRSIPNPY